MANQPSRRPFRLRELLLSQKLLWLIAWLLGIATVLSVLGLVMLSGWFITMAGVAGVLAVGSHAFNYLMPSAIIRGFAIVRTFARYGDLMVSHHAVFGLLRDLRVKFFSNWARLPLSVRLQKGGSSETMQRLVKDIDTLDEFPLRVVSPFVVAVVAVAVLSLIVSVMMPTAWIAVLHMGLALIIAVMTLYKGVQLARRESELVVLRKSKLINTLPALTALITWGRWQDSVRELSEYDERHHQLTMATLRARRNAQALIQLIIALAVVLLLLTAGRIFEQGITPFVVATLNSHTALNPAMVLALTLGVFGLMEIISALVGEPLAYGRSVNAKVRINELMSVDSTPQKQPIDDNPTLILKDLSIKMPSAIMSVDGICATLTPTTPTLIMGASGAGKSTLLATLAGEVPRMSGEMVVRTSALCDVDMDNVDFGRSFGFLGQNVDIFDQSLADNLRLGKPSATDDELWAVLDKVGLSDWTKHQPKGLDTPLGEYGMAISGGQGRRVALARLLLSPKKVLLLDEPFAGLDSTTRHQVWQSLTDMQQAGEISVLAIATHQIWDEMGDVNVVRVG
ncbi:ATP-binding cassette domain-containing protein [Moraxella bovis]|uniref:ATP-binding cassette domain-containing protein n=1 Tax=Moraxella bovis TaxID=476 RepID=A0AAQ2T3P3_MORBO|nr:ATP-binding cassette domain-containing protein [Moraxella bovis]AWY20732.1 cysteine ABC transporter [Moraxella bovis]UYZ76586.1 ATP-binding cassette domain-containing protein [Moraxella bovis]UYZ77462.1 ATP-binding cassette domain-containing protein [Moraxella bovis]UYZ82059.1 ATP-binding cassette domain-containing protein [Moraxella bovis]UYZ85948.1 ATP-binding cassette domain-containing protein [Moraxella bovis]